MLAGVPLSGAAERPVVEHPNTSEPVAQVVAISSSLSESSFEGQAMAALYAAPGWLADYLPA
jgi:hypothetical protein